MHTCRQVPEPGYLCAQAEACRVGQLYVVNIVSAQRNVLSEVVFNSDTGCMGANTVKVCTLTLSLSLGAILAKAQSECHGCVLGPHSCGNLASAESVCWSHVKSHSDVQLRQTAGLPCMSGKLIGPNIKRMSRCLW